MLPVLKGYVLGQVGGTKAELANPDRPGTLLLKPRWLGTCIFLLCCCRVMRRYFRHVWVSWPQPLKLLSPRFCPLEQKQSALPNVTDCRHLLELAAAVFYHWFHS